MPFFFLLSGYLHKDSSDFKPYFIKNFKGLMIPYLILPLIVSIYIIPFRIHYNQFDLQSIIISYFTAGPSLPGVACWFLYCLFTIKIMAYFILKVNKWLQVILVFTLFFIVYLHLFKFRFKIDVSFFSFIFFFLGYYLKKIDILSLVQKLNMYVVICFIIILFSVLVVTSRINGPVNLYTVEYGNSIFLCFFNAIIGSCMLIMLAILFNNISSKFVVVISSGTVFIMVFDLINWLYIIITNYQFKSAEWNVVLNILVSVAILFILYYPILFIKKHCPIIIGGR